MATPACDAKQAPLLQEVGERSASWLHAPCRVMFWSLFSGLGLACVTLSHRISLPPLSKREDGSALANLGSLPGPTQLRAEVPCAFEERLAPEVPWLQILGGPPALPLGADWVPRVCVPSYEGPHCSNATSWSGIVTLCIEGLRIEGVRMKTRGHVSALFPKHQFSLKLPRTMGLLGMAPSKKWVLATSFIDTSYQRNPTAFDLYRLLGGWSAASRYVSLRWRGKDFGLYYIGEKPQRSPGRLEIPPAVPEDPARSGFLLVADWKKPGGIAVKSATTSTFFNVIYPKPKDLTPAERAYLSRLVNEVDRRAADLAAPHGGLEEVLDFPSFVRYFIVQELAKDLDGYAFSDYLSAQGGKLYHAAPWDFDLAFGFACMPAYYTNAFTGVVSLGVAGWNVENLRTMAYWIGEDGSPGGSTMEFGMNKRQLFLNIWRHPRFARAFATTWRSARAGPLADAALLGMVERRAREITPAAKHDIGLWNRTQRCAFWHCCHPEDSHDFASATLHLSQYLQGRARWIDGHLDGLPGR